MTAAARQRGVVLTSQSRPLCAADFSQFDYIIGMDPTNLKAMQVRELQRWLLCCAVLCCAVVPPAPAAVFNGFKHVVPATPVELSEATVN